MICKLKVHPLVAMLKKLAADVPQRRNQTGSIFSLSILTSNLRGECSTRWLGRWVVSRPRAFGCAEGDQVRKHTIGLLKL